MGYYKKKSAEGVFRVYKENLENQVKVCKANLERMSFENADGKEQMEEYIKSMIRECEDAIQEMKYYYVT